VVELLQRIRPRRLRVDGSSGPVTLLSCMALMKTVLLELLLAALVWRTDGSDTAAKAAAATLWGAMP